MPMPMDFCYWQKYWTEARCYMCYIQSCLKHHSENSSSLEKGNIITGDCMISTLRINSSLSVLSSRIRRLPEWLLPLPCAQSSRAKLWKTLPRRVGLQSHVKCDNWMSEKLSFGVIFQFKEQHLVQCFSFYPRRTFDIPRLLVCLLSN